MNLEKVITAYFGLDPFQFATSQNFHDENRNLWTELIMIIMKSNSVVQDPRLHLIPTIRRYFLLL